MTLLDDRLISPNGLEIARFFDTTPGTSIADVDADEAAAYEDEDLDMAYTVWN